MSARIAIGFLSQMLGPILAAGLGLSACVPPSRHAACADAINDHFNKTLVFDATKQFDCDRRLDYVNSNPQQPPDIASAVQRGTVFVGMPSSAVYASFGLPNHVKLASNGIEHWIYGYPTRHGFRTHEVIELRDGRVTNWKAWR